MGEATLEMKPSQVHHVWALLRRKLARQIVVLCDNEDDFDSGRDGLYELSAVGDTYREGISWETVFCERRFYLVYGNVSFLQ